jgi:Contractile injection system tube protein
VERASFIVEKTGERIDCLLNPASVIVRRLAGVQHRHSSTGPLSAMALKDDPLLYTGGGMTELLLDLLFDTSLAGPQAVTEDVRSLTAPLARLAEGSDATDGLGQAPLVRFVWGKAWNVLGVVTALAERLEYFNAEGAPQRSWLRMRLQRVSSPILQMVENWIEDVAVSELPDADDVPIEDLRFFEMTGSGEEEGEGGQTTERLDEVAYRMYGNPTWWRRIANFNDLDNPWEIEPGKLLSIPPESARRGEA